MLKTEHRKAVIFHLASLKQQYLMCSPFIAQKGASRRGFFFLPATGRSWERI